MAMLLEIAAAHGHDPADPRRAAEVLVIRGRRRSVEEALESLAAACRPPGDRRRSRPGGRLRQSVHAREVLQSGAARLRTTPALDLVLGAMSVASFVIPLIGVPACAYGAARATRRLGRRATEFYGSGSDASRWPALPPDCTLTLPPAPTGRAVFASAVAVAATIALGLALSVLWVGDGHHGLWRVGLAVLWVLVLAAHARLGLLLWGRRPPWRSRVARGQLGEGSAGENRVAVDHGQAG